MFSTPSKRRLLRQVQQLFVFSLYQRPQTPHIKSVIQMDANLKAPSSSLLNQHCLSLGKIYSNVLTNTDIQNLEHDFYLLKHSGS